MTTKEIRELKDGNQLITVGWHKRIDDLCDEVDQQADDNTDLRIAIHGYCEEIDLLTEALEKIENMPKDSPWGLPGFGGGYIAGVRKVARIAQAALNPKEKP